jgi:DNA primase
MKPNLATTGIFDALRGSVPLERVIDGAEIGRMSRCANPGHEDQHPSMHLYDDGHVYCFACGFHGDVVDVWGAVRGIAQPFEAALDLAREFNVALPEMSEEGRQRAEERRQKIADDKRLAQVCHEALGKHCRVREWWEKRGFDGEAQRRFLLGANNDGTEAVIPF